MERLIEVALFCSSVLVPLMAVWGVLGLYMLRGNCPCEWTQFVYFFVLLCVAGVTIRTVLANDDCWLIHTSSLGVMIVAGVLRRPSETGSNASVVPSAVSR